jgi:hypothetical protein
VRHVRMLCLCLCALVALGAMMATGASAASGSQKQKEKLEAKALEAVKNCPLETPGVEECYAGITSGGKNGGFFELGTVKVPLSKPVTLQGGAIETEVPNAAGQYGFRVLSPTDGAETLESPELPVPGGLNVITELVQKESEWPAALAAAFKEAKKHKETGLNVKIEVSGESLYENPHALSSSALAFEQGNAFELPLKVRMISPFLEKLGGGPCEFGGGEQPILQELTSEPTKDAAAGNFYILAGGSTVALTDSQLTDLDWSVPKSARAKGCGGEYESYVDKAINVALGQEGGKHDNPGETNLSHGITILKGDLYLVAAEYAKEAA